MNFDKDLQSIQEARSLAATAKEAQLEFKHYNQDQVDKIVKAMADAEVWKALESHPGALENTAVQKCLHHIHLAQRSFLSVVRSEQLVIKRLEDFSNMNELKEYAKTNYSGVLAFIKDCTESKLAEVVRIPWLRNPQLNLPVAQALLQAAMHSQYHCGQNATRLKEMGGQPPLTDIIAWYWKNRPTPQWT